MSMSAPRRWPFLLALAACACSSRPDHVEALSVSEARGSDAALAATLVLADARGNRRAADGTLSVAVFAESDPAGAAPRCTASEPVKASVFTDEAFSLNGHPGLSGPHAVLSLKTDKPCAQFGEGPFRVEAGFASADGRELKKTVTGVTAAALGAAFDPKAAEAANKKHRIEMMRKAMHDEGKPEEGQ